MKILVKLGGTLLEDPQGRADLARQLAGVAKQHELVIVHGGGKQVTRFMEARGITSRFVGGLRVSDDAVIEAVTQVIAGGINKQLVATLIATGAAAAGISGVDGGLTEAAQLNEELGMVGKPGQTSPLILDLLVKGGYVPVVACIAGDRAGRIYNVNADQMAVSCALGWKADRLLFLTDVSGVRNASGEVARRLTVAACQELIASGVAQGGMQAKLEAACEALKGGLSEITIALGRERDVCVRWLAGTEPVGTAIFPDGSGG